MNSYNNRKEATLFIDIDNFIIKNFASLVGTIADSCELLKSNFGIEHFSCHLLFENSQYISLSNNLNIYQSMRTTGFLQDIPAFILQGLGRTGIFFLHEKTLIATNFISYRKFFKENKFSENLCFVNIIRTKEPAIILFNFDIKNSCITRYNLINNLDLLKEFCHYFFKRFKNKLEKLPRIPINKTSNYLDDFKKFIAASQKTKNDPRDLFTIWLHKHQTPQTRIPKPHLTEREKEILIATYKYDYTSKQIAKYLTISKRTVDRHFENMRLKLNAVDKLDLINKALAFGMVKIEENSSTTDVHIPLK